METRLIAPFCKECITKMMTAVGYLPTLAVDESESPAHYAVNGDKEKRYCTYDSSLPSPSS